VHAVQRDTKVEEVTIDRDVFAYPPDEDGSVNVLVEGRFKYRVRKEILDANTHLP
jgi:hypothetical protein